jgi:hypothetical protein
MNPFVSLNVQPSYGNTDVLVSWQVLPGYEDALFFLYKSYTGEAPWTLLNEVTPEGDVVAINGTSFVDSEFIIENRVTDTHYRMLLRMGDENGTEYESPVVSMFGKLTRRQWGGTCKMLRREHLRMSSGNGVEVLHYIPLNSGELNPHYDPDTGQHLSPDCLNDPSDSYGLKYKGGYAAPKQTFIEFADVGPIVFQDRDDGMGHDDPIRVQARMLAHPRPNRGHLIVHTASDNRYVVGDTIKGYYFRGIVAIRYDVTLHLLRRNDARYRVPIPEAILFG